MDPLSLQAHTGVPLQIDVCWSCHLIWFDNLESAALSPGSVIALFRRIHEARDHARNLVGLTAGCPKCGVRLQNTSDLGKSGRFTYSRCTSGHGRLISFTQFLREKNFIRSLKPHEIATLAVKVKQIRCSSCGGPIDLERDQACAHCGSAIAVLDEAAVEKALNALHEREIARNTISPERLAEAIVAAETARRQRPRERPAWGGGSVDSPSDLVDLVEAGVGAALAAFFD